MIYDRQFGLPQSMVNYLNQPLPDISGILSSPDTSGILSLPVAQSEPISNQEIESLTTTGLTPEQLALLYPQVREGGGDEGFAGNLDTTNNAGITSLSDIPGVVSNAVNAVTSRITPLSLLGTFFGGPLVGLGIGAFQANQAAKARASAIAQEAAMKEAARVRSAQKQKEVEQAQRAAKLNKKVYDRRAEATGRSSFGSRTAEEAAYGSCFIAGTKVTMADGTFKNIEDIKVGDKVKGHKGNNEVIKLDPTLLANRKLYSFNDNEHYFFTSEHPFMTEEGWKSIKPEKTKERDGIELYNQLEGELKIDDKLVTEKGLIQIKEIKSKEMNDPKMPLYNFNVSNDNSYIADGYVVHNKGVGGSADPGGPGANSSGVGGGASW
jgi:hypothetical protein